MKPILLFQKISKQELLQECIWIITSRKNYQYKEA